MRLARGGLSLQFEVRAQPAVAGESGRKAAARNQGTWRQERHGRYDLPNNAEFLKSLATDLKKACGTGGTIAENTVEIQGDYRNRIRQLLMSKGWTVKG